MNKLLGIVALLLVTTAAAYPKNQSKKISLDEKIGQMLIVGFQGTELDEQTRKTLIDNHIGGVVLFEYNVSDMSVSRNILNPVQLRRLTDEVKKLSSIPMFVSIDQEGGNVARLNERLGFFSPPSPMYICRSGNLDSAATYAAMNAEQLQQMGINLNFVPCVDLNVNPENPVIGVRGRAFSADPAEVVEQAEIVIREHHRKEILTSLKHFPGHGSSRTDSHLGFTDITEIFSDTELEPYRVLIKRRMADMVMVSHLFNANIDDTYPASLSEKTINGVLRNGLGFKGVVVTDDLNMGAITDEYTFEHAVELAIGAGVDIIVIGNNGKVYHPDLIERTAETIKNLVWDGKISEKRIDESYKRIMKLKQRIN